ncbi:MAG TPA: DUF6174 domain-containing protein [Gemmatimonadaceae bacterium]|nr:DUF6174 domain-containing protein [Gemmatimonadaceae bacterium]
MTDKNTTLRRTTLAIALVAVAASTACDGSSVPSGLGTQQLSISGDTVTGSGQLAELQQRRAAWLGRGIKDYRVQLQISCFCGGDVRRPVLVEVRRGVVSKVWDLETAKLLTNLEPYPSITALFDRAIEQRSGGGHVSVTYDRELGFPTRIEIGTLANDAGTEYQLGAFTRL